MDLPFIFILWYLFSLYSKLGDRFAQLAPNKKKQTVTTQKKNNVASPKTVANIKQSKDKRKQKMSENRNLTPNTTPSKVDNNVNKKKVGKDGKKDTKKKDKKEKKVKIAPPTKTDLDGDMDAYWHAVGKGPDPKVVALDRELDEYRKAAASTPA